MSGDARTVLIGVAGGEAERLVEAAVELVGAAGTWLAVHVVDTRPRVELGLLRGAIPGGGRLGRQQQSDIEAAATERARSVLIEAERVVRNRALTWGGARERVGEPGREVCAAAREAQAHLVIVLARRHSGGPEVGPPSVGHTAHFILDHAPCPVLLLRRRL